MLKFIKLWIGLLLFALFIGRGLGGAQLSSAYAKEIKGDEPRREAIYSPVEIPYIIANPIEIVVIELNEEPDQYFQYFQIRGLLDIDVEDRINEELFSLFNQMLLYGTGEKLPPYRGIARFIDEDRRVAHSYISIVPHFNYNNVLSVVAHVSVFFERGYFYYSDALNFDLTTGNTFLIQDVFADDIDGLGIVNQAIVDELSRRRLTSDMEYMYGSISMVAPFKGIGHEQKFYLDEHGLYVIIDFNNPCFDVGFSYYLISIPLSSNEGYIAVTHRFDQGGKSIFMEDRLDKRFLPRYHEEMTSRYDDYVKNGIHWDVYVRYPNDLPLLFQDIVEGLQREAKKRAAAIFEEAPFSAVSLSIEVAYVGTYVTVSSYLSFANKHYLEESSYVFTKSGELLELGDVFVEGLDYFTLMKEMVERTIHDYRLAYEGDLKLLLDGLMFKLFDSSILLITQSYPWAANQKYPLYFSMSYQEIGAWNLRIFDEGPVSPF